MLKNEIITIIGCWGSGKSTVCKILKKIILNIKVDDSISFRNADNIYKSFMENETIDKHNIVIHYEALQFEEESQVTSQLYNKIADAIKKQTSRRSKSCKAYYQFRSVAYLKRESFIHKISLEHIFVLIKFLLFTAISKILIDLLISQLVHYSEFTFIELLCSIWNIKLIEFYNLLLYSIIFVTVIFNGDKILSKIAGILPRASHVEILKNISLDQDYYLIILIDEIDRLSATAIKLLFDEVVIIKECLDVANINCKIFLFYDEDVILHQYRQLNTYEPHIYLQKFYDRVFRLNRINFEQSLSTALMILLLPSKSDILKAHISLKERITVKLPSVNVLLELGNSINSFRKLHRLIDFLSNHISINEVITGNISDYNELYFISLFIKFLYDATEIELKPDKIYYSFLVNMIDKLQNVYQYDNSLNSNQYFINQLNSELNKINSQSYQFKQIHKSNDIKNMLDHFEFFRHKQYETQYTMWSFTNLLTIFNALNDITKSDIDNYNFSLFSKDISIEKVFARIVVKNIEMVCWTEWWFDDKNNQNRSFTVWYHKLYNQEFHGLNLFFNDILNYEVFLEELSSIFNNFQFIDQNWGRHFIWQWNNEVHSIKYWRFIYFQNIECIRFFLHIYLKKIIDPNSILEKINTLLFNGANNRINGVIFCALFLQSSEVSLRRGDPLDWHINRINIPDSLSSTWAYTRFGIKEIEVQNIYSRISKEILCKLYGIYSFDMILMAERLFNNTVKVDLSQVTDNRYPLNTANFIYGLIINNKYYHPELLNDISRWFIMDEKLNHILSDYVESKDLFQLVKNLWSLRGV